MIRATRYTATSHPIMGHIAIQDGFVTASDLEFIYREKLQFDMPEGCLPAKDVAAIMPSLQEGWSCETRDGLLLFRSGRSCYRIPTIPISEYPFTDEIHSDRSVTIPVTDSLRHALKMALLCAAKDDVRFYLRSALLRVTAEGVTVVGTDGHRLFETHLDLPRTGPNGRPVTLTGDVLLSRRLCKEIASAQPSELIVMLDQNAVLLRGEHWSLSCKGIQAEYPDYRRAIKPNTASVTLDAGHIATALGRVAFVAAGEKFQVVQLCNRPDGLCITATSGQKHAEEWVESDPSVEFNLRFSLHYLLDIFSAIGAGDVVMRPSIDDDSGTLFEVGDWLFIIMQIKA